MPTILLIRHAENDFVTKGRLAGRLPGIHLNEKGKVQAAEIGKSLSSMPIKAIYSSPLERCVETARPLAQQLKVPVVQKKGLTEIDFGSWQNRTLKQLRRRKLWKVVQNNPARMEFPGGETFAEAQLRIVSELETILKAHKSRDVIACFSHSDLIRLAVAYYIGTSLDLFQRIMISPASVSTLHLGEQGVSVINVNQNISFSHANGVFGNAHS